MYLCQMCDKKFKTPDFVHKHIFNKHADELDQKFKHHRFEDLMKENFFNDPSRLQYTLGGYASRDGYRRDFRRGPREFGGEERKRQYVDYDDPKTQAAL